MQLSMIRAAGVLAMLPNVPTNDVTVNAVVNAMIPVLQLIGSDDVQHGALENLVNVYEGRWKQSVPMLRDVVIVSYTRNASRLHPNNTTIWKLLEAIVDMCLLFGIDRDTFESALADKERALMKQGVSFFD